VANRTCEGVVNGGPHLDGCVVAVPGHAVPRGPRRLQRRQRRRRVQGRPGSWRGCSP
jgi:hypothetical protein